MKLYRSGNQHKLEWSTGRSVNVCGGVVGIGSDGEVYSGHDARFHFGPDDSDQLTNLERRELAEFMIEQWKSFGQIG